ncbi:hypothetical protein FJV76_30130 [Mesorhizobium sp. WSM4303]|uniref:hypothetical protein n=1 Tax=unclassified Mesorhizobium TaxID=325217 RepID=UPI00115C57EF|nr:MULTISPECIES: hypothetical protein [unclassified Mesorhizobium]TRC85245.1 hypothetical protein FJV77_31640 [Mesorhizobium sp. WSM4306]TRC94946.1 hypothetical protein FJV76_30130 [Mesorhizobium sp. WSM4303]
MTLQEGVVMRPYSTTRRPVTSERIGRALDRVAEIIVARGGQGEAWLPLYDYLEGAMQDLQAKETRLAAVRERFKQSKG